MLLARYLSIFGSGVKALMAQVLLEESKPIARIIKFYGVDSKAISQPVWANVMTPTSLRIYQFW